MKALKKMTTLAMGIAAHCGVYTNSQRGKMGYAHGVCGNEFPFGNGGRFCR